jgi:hypothetical protein
MRQTSQNVKTQKQLVFVGFRGGRGWDRTSDPYDVNVVLSSLVEGTMLDRNRS